MTNAGTHQIAKETWDRWSFYIDAIIFIIIAVLITMLIKDSIFVGILEDSSGRALTNAWFNIARDIVILAVALTWIFFRLYQYRGKLERRYR